MSPGPRRGLAAIMFADMVGFTALMGEDEAAARAERDRQREVIGRLVGRFHGEVRQYYGDGTLSTFKSAVEAARCAVAIQRELATVEAVPLRIGLHVGDIADEGDGVYGAGVNVAARVETLAPAGGVVVSDKVLDEIKNHREFSTVSLGQVQLKNVARSVEVFALVGEGLADPEGGRRAPYLTPGIGPAAKRATVLAAGVVLALAGVWGVTRVLGGAGPGAASPQAGEVEGSVPSVAVIPFRNLNADEENAGFFADGLHDDVLTKLAKIGSLKVIARTSVMRYAGTDLPIPEIGRALGVGAVLEGGVQRAGNRVHLNVQLIDSRSDAHLWAETYDRELSAENVFAIQTELSEAISAALHAVLTGEERRALARVPTESLEAYELYLRASAALRRDGGGEDLAVAEAVLDSAVALDPGFALARARLAYVHLNHHWNAFDRTDRRLEMARAALERAEVLDPGDPEVLIARGYFHYWGFREYRAALAAFESAQGSLPGDARVYEARAYVRRRMGQWEEAVADLETAVDLDPLNGEILRALGQTHMHMGDYEAARLNLARALTVEPGRWSALYDQGLLDLLESSDVSRLRAAVARPGPNNALTYVRWWLAYLDGDGEGASRVAASVEGPLEQQASIHTRALLNALMHGTQGRGEAARAAADSARVTFRELTRTHPEDPRAHAGLGTALALLGARDDAVAAGREAVRLLPVEADAMDGPEYLLHLARIHALLGESDAVVAVLRELLSRPSGNSLKSVLIDPVFALVRGHPGLTELGAG